MPRNYILHKPDHIIKKLSPFVQKYFPYHKSEIKGTGILASLNKGAVVKIPYDLAIGQVYEFQGIKKEKFVKVQIKKLCLNKFLLKVSFNIILYCYCIIFSTFIKMQFFGHLKIILI